MIYAPDTIDRAVVFVMPNDKFVGFSGNIYTVVSTDIDDNMNVCLEFSHASKPGETATMTFSNPKQTINILK